MRIRSGGHCYSILLEDEYIFGKEDAETLWLLAHE
jgi:hypothetical protein